MSKTESVTVEVTYTNAEAYVLEKVINAFLGGGAGDVKSVKGPYRLSNNLKLISESLETYKKKLGELGEKHIQTEEYEDDEGNTQTRKVQAMQEVKNDNGEWVTEPATGPNGEPQYVIADPEAYAKDMNDLAEEEVTLTLSRVPLSMLDGAKNTAQLFYHGSDFIYED